MNNIDRVRTEIERRKASHEAEILGKTHPFVVADLLAKTEECGEILAFIDSMPKDLLIHGNTDSYQWGYERAVDKACEWLVEHSNDYLINDKYPLPCGEMSRDWLKVKSEMFDDFRKVMEA